MPLLETEKSRRDLKKNTSSTLHSIRLYNGVEVPPLKEIQYDLILKPKNTNQVLKRKKKRMYS